eukprot:Opistho-2@38792
MRQLGPTVRLVSVAAGLFLVCAVLYTQVNPYDIGTGHSMRQSRASSSDSAESGQAGPDTKTPALDDHASELKVAAGRASIRRVSPFEDIALTIRAVVRNGVTVIPAHKMVATDLYGACSFGEHCSRFEEQTVDQQTRPLGLAHKPRRKVHT